MGKQLVYIIFRKVAPIRLTKKAYSGWREIQTEFDDYTASLGPWTIDAVIEYLRFDYSWFDGAWTQRVLQFGSSADEAMDLSPVDSSAP